MRNNWMRTISFMLSLCMIMSFLPMGVWAERGTSTASSITPADETAVITFIFNVDGSEYGRQNIKSGEALIEPEAPYQDSMKFLGWYTEEDTQFTAFNQPMLINTDAEITLTAKFQEVYYVYFLNAENGSVLVTKEAKDGETVSVSDVSLHLYTDTALTGWKNENGQTVGESVTVDGANITLTPIISDGYWITYESGSGSSYIWPTFVPPGGVTHLPVEPVRPGYVFSHWSLSENGTEYRFGSVLTESITLHAVWTPDTNTGYLVIHWWENADDTAYSYHESEALRGTTGAKSAARAKNYDGFTPQAITQQPIAADGSTIVNIYYTRNVYTIEFQERSIY